MYTLLQVTPSSSIAEGILTLLIYFGICIALFLLIRFFFLWYWRINDIVENQERQLSAMKAIIIELRKANGVVMTAQEEADLL